MKFRVIPVRRNTKIQNFYRIFYSSVVHKKNYRKILKLQFQQMFQKKYSMLTPSGRSAFELYLKSLKLSQGDEIIFANINFHILIEVSLKLNLKVIFVDCDQNHLIDIDDLQRKITGKTRIIVATHLFGSPSKVDEILLATKTNKRIKIIEDCAHSLGTYYKNKLVGTFADAAFFSFQNRKIINGLTGGMLLSNTQIQTPNIKHKNLPQPYYSAFQTAKRYFMNLLYQFITNGFVYNIFLKISSLNLFSSYIKHQLSISHHTKVAKRKGFSQFQANLVLHQLKNLTEIIEQRKKVVKTYNSLWQQSNLKSTSPLLVESSIYAAIIQVENPSAVKSKLLKLGIDSKISDEIMTDCNRKYNKKYCHFKDHQPWSNSLELPMYSNIKMKQIRKVVGILEEILGENNRIDHSTFT